MCLFIPKVCLLQYPVSDKNPLQMFKGVCKKKAYLNNSIKTS